MIVVAEEVQKLEHQKRMIEARLDVLDRDMDAIGQKSGELRCQLQRIENALYQAIVGRAV